MPFIKGHTAWNKGIPNSGFKRGFIPWNKGGTSRLKGGHLSEEHKMRISLAKKGKQLPEKTKRKISLALMGRQFSEESKQKMSLASLGRKPTRGMLGKKHSEETKKKLSLFFRGFGLGRKLSEETKRKLSVYHLEYPTMGMQGKHHSEKTKKKMSFTRTLNPNRVFKDTSIELKIQNLLKENGIEFEINYPILGRPDIFIKPNICIFADGCYWHKCSECGFEESVRKEREKDEKITRQLQSEGYTVIRLWEHEINKGQFSGLNQLIN